jgi:hypothetical protein
MTPIEIFGTANSKAYLDAERFCIRMRYPHRLYDVSGDDQLRARLRERQQRPGHLPLIFIGPDQIGGLRDLIQMEPFLVQQLIGQ